MRKCHFFITLLLSLIMIVCFSCKDDKEPSNPTAIELSETEASIEIGETIDLIVNFTPSKATGSIVWESEDESVAKVIFGTVIGLKAGKTNITAICGTLTASCEVTVTKEEENLVPTKIELSRTEAEILEGKLIALAVKFTPRGTTGTIKWKSENDSIASVSNGIIRGIKAGETTITATCGTLTATCKVTVTTLFPPIDEGKLLNGSDYFVFMLDETSFSKLGNRVTKDYRINGDYDDYMASSVLEIWGNTFKRQSTSGLNSFELSEEWISLVQQDGAWTGSASGGIRQRNTTVDLTGVTDEHVLVITYKANLANKVEFVLYSTSGTNEVVFETIADTQGKWGMVEKQMKDLFAQGLNWSNAFIDENGRYFYTLAFIIDGAGSQLDIDAAFVYKPAN